LAGTRNAVGEHEQEGKILGSKNRFLDGKTELEQNTNRTRRRNQCLGAQYRTNLKHGQQTETGEFAREWVHALAMLGNQMKIETWRRLK
jgi:hypothetical protein